MPKVLGHLVIFFGEISKRFERFGSDSVGRDRHFAMDPMTCRCHHSCQFILRIDEIPAGQLVSTGVSFGRVKLRVWLISSIRFRCFMVHIQDLTSANCFMPQIGHQIENLAEENMPPV